jgi:hypothetical protein
MKTTEKELSPIQLWKENGIVRGEFEFQCGGDQMNDTDIKFFNDKGEEVKCEELESYIDGEIYNQVDFYVNSDGHYQGESGVVTIEFEEDADEEEGGRFTYDKQSESEWNESFDEVGYCELTPEEVEIVQKYIHSFVGGGDGEAINYKGDCILNDTEEALLENLTQKICDFATEYQIKDAEGEENDWFTYTTDMEDANNNSHLEDYEYDESNPTLIVGNTIAVHINKSFTIFKED